MNDVVNHPPHYRGDNGVEAIDVVEGFNLGFRLGNAVTYILRADRKGEPIKDLRKSRWYIDREIEAREPRSAQPAVVTLEDKLIYLATPYSKYPDGMPRAFEDAAGIAARLLIKGLRVYSPIAHTHPLALYGNIDPLDHSIWLPFDEAMMRVCDILLVAKMRGWDKSFGIAHEIKHFSDAGKPVLYLDPETFAVSQSPVAAAALAHNKLTSEHAGTSG